MWSRFQTDSTWGECQRPLWPFHLSDWDLCLLLFHGGSFLIKKKKNHLSYIMKKCLLGISAESRLLYLHQWWDALVFYSTGVIFKQSYFLSLTPAHKCLRVQVLHSSLRWCPQQSQGTNRGKEWGDRDPSEGPQTSCAHLAPSLRRRTEGGRRNITGYNGRRSRDKWLFGGLWPQTLVI